MAIEGETDEVDLLAAVAVGFGVTLLLDLVESLLGCAVDLELEDMGTPAECPLIG